MVGQWLSLNEAASRLGVSRIAAQKLVEQDILPAERSGGRWLIDARDVQRRLRNSQLRGRPIRQSRVWERIAQGTIPADDRECDVFRRRMRPRARHVDAFVHRSLQGPLADRTDVVFSGRSAASRLDLPIDSSPDDEIHLYVTVSAFEDLRASNLVQPRHGVADANAVVHVVEDANWSYLNGSSSPPVVTVWLDLADEDDRAERLVREYVLRGGH